MSRHAHQFAAVDIDGVPRPSRSRRNKKNRHRPPRPAPTVLSVPGPGRYLVHVNDDGRITTKSLNGRSIVDADGTRMLQADIIRVRNALTELASRMRIVTGDADLSTVAQPLRVTLAA